MTTGRLVAAHANIGRMPTRWNGSRSPVLLVGVSVAACLATCRAPAAAAQSPVPIAPPQRSAAITTGEIDAHLRFLASDLLEGRAPGRRGGRLAAEYIASALESAGVEPGWRGSYFQPVPIDVVTANHATMRASVEGRASATLRDPADIVVWAGSATATSAAHGELVFVGYGVTAPEYRWDDYKGVDVRGKVLLMLVNEPPATPTDPDLFDGPAMTYYGRWTYKFEEAERRGAVGALIIHTTADAGYPWHTVVSSWDAEQRLLPRDTALPPPLGIRGWITDSAATSLLAAAGLDLSTLRARASLRAFRPLPTGILVDLSFTNRVERVVADNVVGLVRGRDPAVRHEMVVFSAHWDHLGIGPPVDGDSIYNGAEDNASGVADVLAIARAAAASPHARRSLLFLFPTAEESGLLGSSYFVAHPPVPAADLVADLNVDGGDLLGLTRDLGAVGERKSSLGPALARYARAHGMRVSADDHPEQGHFYRSDHFSFARAGVPALSLGAGTDFVGRPDDWGKTQQAAYAAHRYHQPSDEYRPGVDLRGAVRLSQLVLGFGWAIADARAVPTWNAGGEFHRPTSRTAAQP